MEMKKEPDPVSKSNFQRVTKEVMMRRTSTVLFMKKATILSFPLFKIPLKHSAHIFVIPNDKMFLLHLNCNHSLSL